MKTAIEKKWRTTGLLEGIDGIDAELLAHNLEDCAHILIARNRDRDQEFVAGLLLPIVVRLFNTGGRIMNMEMLFNDFDQWLAEKIKTLPAGFTLEYDLVEPYLEYVTTDGRIDAMML